MPEVGPIWRVVARGRDGTRLVLVGELVEGVRLDGILDKLEGPATILDLEGVRRINSFGVRELVMLLEGLHARGRIELERCSPAIVSQLNMLPELSGLVTVRSLLAPMECPRCLFETEHLVDLSRGGGSLSLVCLCEECGAEMDLAEPYERYFAFLSEA